MNKTEQCIDVLQREISGIAEHAYYSACDGLDEAEKFLDFMEVLTNQIEHLACEYLLMEVFGKRQTYFESLTGQPTAYHVQKFINQQKEKK